MDAWTRREVLATGVALSVTSMAKSLRLDVQAQATRSIADFFREFTDDWVRHDPDLATATRYFSGAEQDALERQLTPRTHDWYIDRVRRASDGLAELRRFDRTILTD